MIREHEKQVYSQNGEDGITEFLINKIGVENKFFLEFGVWDGTECCTRYLKDVLGWEGVQWDNYHNIPEKGLYKEFVTVENINELFEKYKIPNKFGVLSIDVDFNDLWFWKAIDRKYRPDIVIIEYNASFVPPINLTVPYDPDGRWDRQTNFTGASLTALDKLGKELGYTLVYCCNRGVNAFFVLNEHVSKLGFEPGTPETIYKRGKFADTLDGSWPQHGEDRQMIPY